MIHPAWREFGEWLESKGSDPHLEDEYLTMIETIKEEDRNAYPATAKGNCEMMAEMHRKAGVGGSEKSVEAFLLVYGEEFNGNARPEWVEQMTPKMCFMNCYLLVEEQQEGLLGDDVPELTYVEGYVLQSGLPIPIHHAWCVTDDGTVIDPTLQDRTGEEETTYFGVRIPFRALEEIVAETGSYSVLFKRKGHAILKRVCTPKGDSDADDRD